MRSRTKFSLCVAMGLLWPFTEPSGTSSPKVQADRIMYASFQPSNWNIYLFSESGKSPKRLTDSEGLNYDPVIAPNGRWLVFTSERRGQPNIYALDLQHEGEPHLLIDSQRMEDQATFSPDGKFIYFVGTYSGNSDIYRLPFLPDRTASMKDAENLTHNAAADLRPAISPDGRMMAFSSDRDQPMTALNPIERFRSGDIWTLNLTDGTLHRLTHLSSTGWNGSPKWSSDGRQIVYYSSQFGSKFGAPIGDQSVQAHIRAGEPSRIMVMDADGTNQRAVTPWESGAHSPEFLTDHRILYDRRDKQNHEVIVSVNLDGSGLRIESDDSGNSYWSSTRGPSAGSFVVYGTGPVAKEQPDAYHRPPGSEEETLFGGGPVLVPGAPFRRRLPDREIDLYPVRYLSAILNPRENLVIHSAPSLGPNRPVELWASRVDGSQQRKLVDLEPTPPQVNWSGMNWSKDGQWAAFTRGGMPITAQVDADVWKMRADGSALQNLTPNSPGFDGYPSFSGDGEIVFVSGRDGSLDLYLMNADGAKVRRLTNDHAIDLFPSFSPTSNQIAFVSNRDNPKSDPSSAIFDVYLLDLDPSGAPGKIRRITHDEGQHGHTQFSYDGKWLIFASEAGGINDEQPLAPATQAYGEIYAYRISDGTTIRLTDNKWEEGMASWCAPSDSVWNFGETR
jgi:Tol biopolymer transport system component